MDQGTRIAVLETKVENISSDVSEIKDNVKDLHDCVDRTREELKLKLDESFRLSTDQHKELSAEIKSIKDFKNRWTWTFAGALAALGWASGHADILKKLF